MNPQPSADALALAATLYGHNNCHESPGAISPFCYKCIRRAGVIDDRLQLPQRNAALLLAQGVCDIAQRGFDPYAVGKALDELRDALAAIKSKTP